MKETDRSTHTKPGDLTVSFPPFNPITESLTGEDIDWANRRIGGVLEQEEGHASIPLLVGIGGAGILVVGGGVGGYFIRPLLAADASHTVGIGSFPNSFNNKEQPKINPKEVFYNNLGKHNIGPNNTGPIGSKDDVRTLLTEDQNGKPIYFFPVGLLGGKSLVLIKEEGTNSKIKGIPKGTPVYAMYSGYAFVGRLERDGKIVDDSIHVLFRHSDGNIYRVVLGTWTTPTFDLKFSESIPSLGPDNGFGKEFEKGYRVEKTDLVGEAIDDISEVQVGLAVMLNGNFDPKSRTTAPLNFNTIGNKLAVKNDF